MNGLWEWEKSSAGAQPAFGQKLTGEILVPFPVESCLSGIGANHPDMFYRTTFSSFAKGTTLLHFEAVDWQVRRFSVFLKQIPPATPMLLFYSWAK